MAVLPRGFSTTVGFVLLLSALIGPAWSAHALGDHPSSLDLDGRSLPLAGQAVRTHLLGSRPLYTLALYAPDTPPAFERLADPDVPKALRIEVTFEEDLQRRPVVDWRRELVPSLEPDASAHLRRSFSGLRHGDVVQIEYVPGSGTAVRVNRTVAVSRAHHDLMLAFLDHWIGQQPLSEEIKRALAGTGR
jgi:hypothetical protein